jgi:hypothetical protein
MLVNSASSLNLCEMTRWEEHQTFQPELLKYFQKVHSPSRINLRYSFLLYDPILNYRVYSASGLNETQITGRW